MASGPGPLRQPQLDGLRAFAVLAVLITHYWLKDSVLGHLGVRLFFVLSGYLITRILVDERDRPDFAWHSGIGRFYFRRAVRIMPPYFLLVGLTLAVGLAGARESWLWHVAFASNFYFASINDFQPWVFSHLWSLSIEEQFYLVWPVLIFAAPARARLWLCLAAVAASIVFRVLMFSTYTSLAAGVLPPASFDALAIGAALAILEKDGRTAPGWVLPAVGAAAIAAAIILFVRLPSFGPAGDWAIWVSGEILPLPMFAVLIWYAARGKLPAPIGWGPIAYVGRISYGIYLYHFMVLAIALCAQRVWPGLDLSPSPARFAVLTVATICCASLSWTLMERPLSNLRARISPEPAAIAP